MTVDLGHVFDGVPEEMQTFEGEAEDDADYEDDGGVLDGDPSLEVFEENAHENGDEDEQEHHFDSARLVAIYVLGLEIFGVSIIAFGGNFGVIFSGSLFWKIDSYHEKIMIKKSNKYLFNNILIEIIKE